MAQGTRCAARGSGGAGGRPSTLRRPGLTAPSATEEKKEAGASRLARLRARALRARALRTRACARAPRALGARSALPAPATARTARTALRARRAVRAPRTHYNWPASALTLRALRHLVLASRRTVWRHARRVQRAIRELNRLRVERENSPAAKRLIGSTLAACLKVGLNAWNLLVGYRVSHLRLE